MSVFARGLGFPSQGKAKYCFEIALFPCCPLKQHLPLYTLHMFLKTLFFMTPHLTQACLETFFDKITFII